ncbi:caspase-14-like isoform X1 [Lepisosteus oculatus]|uniref:caspase-14-like isoform X1 n=2 Tax=Lepisosteus oculatus TaxID=7918 RepID=UPI0035F50DC8
MGSAQDKQEIRSKWEILLNSERTDVRWKIMDDDEIFLSQTLENLQRRRRNGDDVQWTKCLLNESSVLKEEYTSLRTRLNPETPEGESADLETELAELCMERCKLLEICCDRLKHYETPIIPILKSKYTYIKSRALVDKSSAICAKQLSKMAIGQSYNSSQGGHPLVSSDPHKYEMSGKRLALMLCVLNRREGALNDIRIMRSLFQSYGFDYTIEINPTAKEIEEAVQRFRDRISSSLEDISCCFVVTASHGDLGNIVGSDEEQVNLNGIIKLFDNDKCPKLRKKPKVFIVQACRGDVTDLGVQLKDEPHSGGAVELPDSFTPAAINDMFTVFATQPGYVALRSREHGSHLFTFLEEVFRKHADRDHLYDLFVKVNERMVQQDFQVLKDRGSKGKEYEIAKVTIAMESTLKKLLYLKRQRATHARTSNHSQV